MSTLINSLLNKPITHTPIWLMRQAGRYLPEYRQIRNKAGSFMSLCTNPELACEVTLQPLRRFNLDAAILFSDILVIPDAMGLGLHFVENEGPKFTNPIQTVYDIDNLQTADILSKLDYVFKAIHNVKAELKVGTPLIGFSGSPFTLACYMLEGGSSKNYLTIKKLLLNNPEACHKLLNKITDVVILYLNAQIEAGVDAVMLFDSWGGVLTENAYLEFSLPYLQKILNSLKKEHQNKTIPSIVFTKGGGLWLEHIAKANTNALGLDWTIDIAKAKLVSKDMVLQGNLDPVILAVGDKAAIKKEATRILTSYLDANDGNISGHVFNLGHGVLPITNPDHVAYLVDTVHEISNRM
ncbi:MAG: uroporphyrinogen decarboxylase [Proteobacteria bacterium]|jgi:uroporphyrinogen decarboxylase|nr:uroporphyrinogen decarboxylase [Pseudomonadota bacterium]